MPPTLNAVSPESLRKSRREHCPGCMFAKEFLVMMVSLPKVFVYDPFRATQPEGTHSPPPCNLMRESYAHNVAGYRGLMQKTTPFCKETCT